MPFALMLAAFSAAAVAGPTPPPVRAEIDALLDRLENSGCQFNSNGSWYSGADARRHLLDELEQFERTGTIKDTRQFIDLVASSNSRSGKPYEVRCTGKPTVTNKEWLTRELVFIRITRKEGH